MIRDIIEKALEEFYCEETGTYSRRNENYERMDILIRRLLTENGIEKFNVEYRCLWEDNTCYVGFVSAAWIENGELMTLNYEWKD